MLTKTLFFNILPKCFFLLILPTQLLINVSPIEDFLWFQRQILHLNLKNYALLYVNIRFDKAALYFKKNSKDLGDKLFEYF